MAAATTADKVQVSQKSARFLQQELIEEFFFLPEPFWLFACLRLKHKFAGSYK